MNSGCKCEPGHPCAEHNAYNKSPVVATGEAGFGSPQLTMGEKKRISCKLCSCEAVDCTLLCREHLQGYMFAVEKLQGYNSKTTGTLALALKAAIEQRKD